MDRRRAAEAGDVDVRVRRVPAREPRRQRLLRPLHRPRAERPTTTVAAAGVVDEIYVGDARRMDRVRSGSVALVVTSPPYFAGKAYEEELGEGHIPATYVEYLTMLEDVFAECVDKLEPGGRIAVNVANLGRKPYRSLSADVIGILQDRLGLLLRGEVIWQQGPRRRRQLRVGLVQAAGQPGAARPHRAGGDRQQGPLRPGRQAGRAGRARACRRVPPPRPTSSWTPPSTVGAGARERHAGRPPGAVPGGAARSG